MTHDLSARKESLPNTFTLEMGKRVRQAREEKGWSQTKLAAEINRRRPSISDIENGKMVSDTITLALISSVLRKPIAYFFPSEWRYEILGEGLSAEEQELLTHFRRIRNKEHKRLAINQVRSIAEITRSDDIAES